MLHGSYSRENLYAVALSIYTYAAFRYKATVMTIYGKHQMVNYLLLHKYPCHAILTAIY